MNDCTPSAHATNGTAGGARTSNFDWHGLSFLAITLSLTAYGYDLAWESWKQLLQLVARPAPGELAVVNTAMQVVAPLLPPLSLLVIYLSWRRDGTWFFRTGALCLLGLLTAAVEVLGHGLR